MASALLVRSVVRMLHAPTGVVADSVVTATCSCRAPGYRRLGQGRPVLHDAARRRFAGRPGVEAAGASPTMPLDPGWRHARSRSTAAAVAARTTTPVAQHICVEQRLLRNVPRDAARGTHVHRTTIAPTSEPVIVVNQTFARRVFPGEDAVGRRLVSTGATDRPARPEPLRPRVRSASSASSPTSTRRRSARPPSRSSITRCGSSRSGR